MNKLAEENIERVEWTLQDPSWQPTRTYVEKLLASYKALAAQRDVMREATIEECAKVADEFAAAEDDVFQKAKNDGALSDSGQAAILLRAVASEEIAKRIAKRIRSL